jgi:hypothetical protein
VHCYKFFIWQRGDKRVPALARFRAHLRSHGVDRVILHVWLAHDATIRKVRLHSELAADRNPRVRSQAADYTDFGIAVDLAVPRPDQVAGKPGRRRTRRRAAQPAPPG